MCGIAAKWLRGYLKPMIEDYLSVTSLKRDGFFNADAVQKVLQGHLSQKEYNIGLRRPFSPFRSGTNSLSRGRFHESTNDDPDC